MENNTLTLGKKIRERRKQLEWTLRDLASKCNVSASYIGYIEKDKSIPSMFKLKEIADALGISISYLLNENELKANEDIALSIFDEKGDKYEVFLDQHIFPNGLTYEQMCDKIKLLEKMEAILKNK